MKQHLARSTGEMIQTLENGLQGFRLVLQHALFTLLPGLAEIVLICLLVLHFLDAAFLAVFALCAAGYALVFADGARRILRASRDVSSARIQASARLADGLMNIETVKAFGGETRLTDRYDEALEGTQARWRRFYRARLANGVMAALVFTSGLGASLFIAAGRVQAGEMTPGDLVLMNAWLLQVVRPLELLGYGMRDIGQGAAFVERLQSLLREPVEPGSGILHAAPGKEAAPMSVEIEKVSFAYPGGGWALEDISFRIEPGQQVALVGPSGCGKSTLLRLLMRLYEPDAGRINIDGRPLADFPVKHLRDQVAFIPQVAGLFNETVAFNVAFPAPALDPGRLKDALAPLGLERLLERSDDNAALAVGESGAQLSGGERQRIAIARALLRRPGLILADEPTSALDPVFEKVVFARLRKAAIGATLVVATHRLDAAKDADLILVMSEGRIIERGSHGDLVEAGGAYARMLRTHRTQ
jgi:ATP-binding cassette subfamily B protein